MNNDINDFYWDRYEETVMIYKALSMERKTAMNKEQKDELNQKCLDASIETYNALQTWIKCDSLKDSVTNTTDRTLDDLTKDQLDNIIERHNAGDSILDICDTYKLAPNSAMAYLYINGISIGKNASVINVSNHTADNRDRIIEMYQNGMKHKDIARKIQCSPSFVTTTLGNARKKGIIPPKPDARLDMTRNLDILSKYLIDGMSYNLIAEQYGCTNENIKRIMKNCRKRGDYDKFVMEHREKIMPHRLEED